MWKKLLITLLIGGFCGYFALRDVHYAALKDIFAQVSWGYFLLALIPMFLSHLLRTLRWQATLAPIKPIGFVSIFGMNAVGFMMVNVLPLRLGELVRPLLVTQREGVPYPAALATCAVERIFDGLAVVLILIIGIGIAPLPVKEIPYLGWSVDWMVMMSLVIFVPALLLLVLLIVFQEQALHWLGRLLSFLPKKFLETFLSVSQNFVSGLRVLKGWKRTLIVFVYSMLIWVMITLMTYCTLEAFHMNIPAYASFTVLGIICVGIMLPGPPGFAGNYELFCKAALALFAVNANLAISFALASHAFNLLFMLVTGLLCLPFSPLKWGQIKSTEIAVDAKHNL